MEVKPHYRHWPYHTPSYPMREYRLKGEDLKTAQNIMNTTEEIVADSAERIGSLYIIKQDNMKFAAFEIGYIVCIIQNKYKKMVDKYETVKKHLSLLYKPEILLMLEEVEALYWEIQHIANMLHEIERKYKLYGSLDEDYAETQDRKARAGAPKKGVAPPQVFYKEPRLKKPRISLEDYIRGKIDMIGKTKARKKPRWFPIDYGWYVEPEARQEVAPSMPTELNDLLNELSWNLKLKLLNDVVPKYPTRSTDVTMKYVTPSFPALHLEDARRRGIKFPSQPRSQLKRRDNDATEETHQIEAQGNEDNDMRMKLFRLMYETVRDSDLKVKRAELIREHYVNSTAFEIGYLLGDVTDKFNVMADIANTLSRFHQEWKPIEHINAYEQIANQAIEINHLVDLIRIVSKRDTQT